MNLFNETYNLNGLDNKLYKALEKRDGYTYAVLVSTLLFFGSLALKIFYNSLKKLHKSLGNIDIEIKASREADNKRFLLNPVVDFSRPLSMGSFIEDSEESIKRSQESSTTANEPITMAEKKIATGDETPKRSDQIITMTRREAPDTTIVQIQAIRPCTLAISKPDINIIDV